MPGLLVVWLLFVNAWGPLALTRDANRPGPPTNRLLLAYCLMATACVLTVVVGAALSRRWRWPIGLLLAPIGAGCCCLWLGLSAVFFGNGLRSVISVAVLLIPLTAALLALLALGWSIGRLARIGLAGVRPSSTA